MSSLRLFVVAACTAAALVALPTHASAAPCYSSTPTSSFLSDAPYDGEAGLAPELTASRLSVDGACGVTFSYDVIGQSAMYAGDFYGWFINADGSTATGPATGFPGAEYAVGLNYDGTAGLAQWIGGTYIDVGPVARTGMFAVSTGLASIGATPGVPISVAGAGSWEGVYDTYYDWVPDIGMPWLSMAPIFQSTPPAPVAPQSVCTVPNVYGLRLAAAKRSLRRSGCPIGATRKRTSRNRVGKVVSTSPRRGARLAQGSRVTIYVGKRAKSSRRSSVAAAPSLGEQADRMNDLLAEASR